MGYAGYVNKKELAREMRKQGHSIKNIESSLKVSRSSASIWTRDIKLTHKQIDKLYKNKKTGQLRGAYIAAENKKRKRIAETAALLKNGESEMGYVNKRESFVAGVALYFAEGDKTGSNVAFSNSDPRVISFMSSWFREYCKVPAERFRCYLYIHDNLNELESRKYWSKVANVPLNQFRKSYIVKNNKDRFRKSKHVHGVLRISISDVKLHRKIMGWISGLFSNNSLS